MDSSVTQLLQRWNAGETAAFDRLMETVYAELRDIAGQCFRHERARHTLQETALVHEAILRLMDLDSLNWSDRGHFYAVASKLMRRVLVDHARRHRRLKRGGVAIHLSLLEETVASSSKGPDMVALDDALDRLEQRNERMAKIVQLRFFAGLTSQEIARSLGVSVPTVTREWRRARVWLYNEVRGKAAEG